MSIGTTKSFADITEGTQVQGVIADATYDPEGRFGPAVELAIEVEKPSAHTGETVLSTFSLSQPRLSKVRDLREDGLEDDAIQKVLEKKGFQFESIDDPETPRLGGALLRIVKACYENDARAIKQLLAECEDFSDLAEALLGKRFVFNTRVDNKDRTRVDGKGDFYRVMSEASAEGFRQKQVASSATAAKEPEVDEPEFNDIPF
jgi:hypothetical protein